MKKVTKKAGLAGMAVLMGAGVVVGSGAMQEPVVQSAEAATVKLGKYKTKKDINLTQAITANHVKQKKAPTVAVRVKKGETIDLVGRQYGYYIVRYKGKTYSLNVVSKVLFTKM